MITSGASGAVVCLPCLPEHHPGYVSWPEYLQTRERPRCNVRPRGEGGGAAREGTALLQGLARCGRCGRRMQVSYAGTGGTVRRYACLRGHVLHATDQTCQSLGGGRLDKAVAAAFLEAVTLAGIAATAGAVRELHDQHDARLAGQRLIVERAEFEADRRGGSSTPASPSIASSPAPSNARSRTRWPRRSANAAKLAALEQARPAPLTDDERAALARLARDLPQLWNAPTTTDRDRKELLRTLVSDVIVTAHRADKRADVEICWEGGARTELTVRLNARGPERRRLPEDTVELIRRLAAHHPDHQIAAILARNGHRTGTGLPFTASRVRSARQRAGIPAAPPADPGAELVTINQAASEPGASVFTLRRWLRDGLLPGEQVAPTAPWRIRLTDETRAPLRARHPRRLGGVLVHRATLAICA